MRALLLLALLVAACAQRGPRTDGVYRTADDGSQECLRFYAGGTVVYARVPSTMPLREIAERYRKEAPFMTEGDWHRDGARLSLQVAEPYLEEKSTTVTKAAGRLTRDGKELDLDLDSYWSGSESTTHKRWQAHYRFTAW